MSHAAPLATPFSQVFAPPDCTHVSPEAQAVVLQSPASAALGAQLPHALVPPFAHEPDAHCMSAPHAAPFVFEPVPRQTAGMLLPKRSSHDAAGNAAAQAAPSNPAPGAAACFSHASCRRALHAARSPKPEAMRNAEQPS